MIIKIKIFIQNIHFNATYTAIDIYPVEPVQTWPMTPQTVADGICVQIKLIQPCYEPELYEKFH